MDRYHYILTLQWAERSGDLHLATSSAAAFFDDGVSEKDRYGKIREAACAEHGAPSERTAVLFYRLVRDPENPAIPER